MSNRSSTPNDEILEALKRFITDNPELERLENLLSAFNLFDALGIGRQELRHSNFFAWLLDPAETHGLGDYFLYKFIKHLGNRERSLTDLVFKVETADNLFDTEVLREWKNIDILVINHRLKFTITIENKFLTKEHSDQLKRYREIISTHFPDYQNIFIYLTPDAKKPEGDDAYIPVGYDLIIDVISDVLKFRPVAEDVRVLLNHYLSFVGRFLMKGEVEELCQAIYRKHKKALDVIFECIKRSSTATAVVDVLLNLLENEFEIFYNSKSYLRFLPKGWDFIPKVAYWKVARKENAPLVTFEFYNADQYGLTLYLLCTPPMKEYAEQYAQHLRILLSLGELKGAPFRKVKKPEKLLRDLIEGKTDRAAIYSKKVIPAKDYETLSAEELEERIRNFLEEFKKGDLKIIEQTLKEVFL
jgi:hypothetical protein